MTLRQTHAHTFRQAQHHWAAIHHFVAAMRESLEALPPLILPGSQNEAQAEPPPDTPMGELAAALGGLWTYRNVQPSEPSPLMDAPTSVAPSGAFLASLGKPSSAPLLGQLADALALPPQGLEPHLMLENEAQNLMPGADPTRARGAWGRYPRSPKARA